MTSIVNLNIKTHNESTKKRIKNIDKPLSSFNYYLKEMRENWNTLSDHDKEKYSLNYCFICNTYIKDTK